MSINNKWTQPRLRSIGGLCLLLGLAGCANELPPTDSGALEEESPVRIAADISTLRAAGDEIYDHADFEAGEKIRVKKTVDSSVAQQVDYTYSGSSWAASSSLTLTANAVYQGFYPAVGERSIQADQSTEENYKSSDWLDTPEVRSQDGTLDFTGENAFKHVNAKLSLKLTFKNATDFTGQVVTVKGTGILSGGDSEETITLYQCPRQSSGKTVIYTGIFHPTKSSVTVSLTRDGVSYHGSIMTLEFGSSEHIIYQLTVQDNVLVPVGSTITEWTDHPVYTGPIGGAAASGEGGGV